MNKYLTFCLSAMCCFALVACGKGPQDSTEVLGEHAGEEHGGESHTDIVLTPDAAKTAGIEIVTVSKASLQAEIKVPGVVASTAKGRALVTPPIDGKVSKLLATVGDVVRKGQILAIIESAGLATGVSAITEAERSLLTAEADLKRSNAELNLAKGRLRTAKANFERQRELAKSGAFSQPSVQEAERNLNEAESELQAVQADEAVHSTQLDRAERLFKQELISKSDLEMARLALAQDRVRHAKADRSLQIAKSTLDREKLIASKGLLTAREVQGAESEVRAANLEVEREKISASAAQSAVVGAKRAYQNAKANYAALAGTGNHASGSSVSVVASMDGVIAHREVSVGQAVERTTELFEIDNLTSVWVTASVPEEQISKVHRGTPVQVRTAAYPDRVFVGAVEVVGTRLDPKTRSMPVQCAISNADGALKPDMFTEVRISYGSRSDALVVPSSAVLQDGDESIVYIAEDGGKFEKVVVSIGRVQGNSIEVLTGLETGQKIVVKGGFVLKSQAQKDELKGHED